MGTIVDALDLRGNVVLKRFELHIGFSPLLQAHEWVLSTLRSIASSAFNEFVIWILSCYGPGPEVINGWKTVDLLLCTLAERNPDFRVVFRGDHQFLFRESRYVYDGGPLIPQILLPDFFSKGFAKFEYAVDNPCRDLYLL